MPRLPVQFVWVKTSTLTLNIPDSATMLTISAQLNANLARVNAVMKGTLTPKNATGFPTSTITQYEWFTSEGELSGAYNYINVTTTATNTDYLTKDFFKISAPLHETRLITSKATVPSSYTSLEDLKRLYNQIHPNYATTTEDYNTFQTNTMGKNGRFIVFITNLTDKSGLPVPHLDDYVSTPGAISQCVAISAWTLGHFDKPNTWVNDTTVFDRVPWCRNMRMGGALVFALCSKLGLRAQFDSLCNNTSLHRYPNINVTGYNDNKSNLTINSKQLPYFGSNPTITCTNETEGPYNVMDMSSDDVRYYLSDAQRIIMETVVPLDRPPIVDPPPTNPDPENPDTEVDPEIFVPDVFYPEPSPTIDYGWIFLAMLVLWAILFVTICQVISIMIYRNPSIYYKYINPMGYDVNKDTSWMLTHMFVKDLLLPPNTQNTSALDLQKVQEIIGNDGRSTLTIQQIRALRLLGFPMNSASQLYDANMAYRECEEYMQALGLIKNHEESPEEPGTPQPAGFNGKFEVDRDEEDPFEVEDEDNEAKPQANPEADPQAPSGELRDVSLTPAEKAKAPGSAPGFFRSVGNSIGSLFGAGKGSGK
jgi:hypothetical protein